MEITFLVDKEGRPPSWYHDPATGVDHITMYSGGYLWDDFTQWFTACAGKAPSRGDTSYGEMCILLYKVWYQGNLRVRVDYPLAHLHPDYQAQWFDLLVQLPKLKEVYIATNSPALINRAGHLIASDKLSDIRFSAILKYSVSNSIPMKLRLRFLQATPVLPLPMQLSRTVSPSMV